METKVIVICCIAGFLGLLSAATGFGAEITRIKVSDVITNPNDSLAPCTYPRSPALGLGLTAAVSLLLAQIILSYETGCLCCRRTPRTSNVNWAIPLITFSVSWFAFVLAFLLLLTGAALNDQRTEHSMYYNNYYCYVVKPGVFAGGAVLSLASVILAIIYYLNITSAKNQPAPTGNQTANGVAMGHPQFPPNQTTQDPVFVHEDTYMRRQFA